MQSINPSPKIEIQKGRNMNAQDLSIGYSVPNKSVSRWGRGFVAVCGTTIFWGVGHCLAGCAKRGFAWFLTSMILFALIVVGLINPSIVYVLIVAIPVSALLGIAVFIDAFRCARRSTHRMFGRPLTRYLVGAGLLVLGLGVGQVLIRLVYAPFIHGAGARTYVIDSHSMEPTFGVQDRVLTNRIDTPARWDLVIYHPPVKPQEVFLGRIAGLPGEKIEIANGGILVNGSSAQLPPGVGPYVSPNTSRPTAGTEGHPITLAANEYFILGDNSQLAYDGRYWADAAPGYQLGAVPGDWIVGRVTARYYPFNRLKRF